MPITAAVDASEESLADGDCESEPDKRKSVADWISRPYETFNIRATIDAEGVFTCRLKPFAVFHDEVLGVEYDWLTLPLWSQEVVAADGKTVGVFRKGSGQPAGFKRWIPNFRCDNRVFGAGDANIEDRRGGCINTRAKRVFVMSYSRNANFAEVIKHIEDATADSTGRRNTSGSRCCDDRLNLRTARRSICALEGPCIQRLEVALLAHRDRGVGIEALPVGTVVVPTAERVPACVSQLDPVPRTLAFAVHPYSGVPPVRAARGWSQCRRRTGRQPYDRNGSPYHHRRRHCAR
jgi:hypothetical protein